MGRNPLYGEFIAKGVGRRSIQVPIVPDTDIRVQIRVDPAREHRFLAQITVDGERLAEIGPHNRRRLAHEVSSAIRGAVRSGH